MTVTGANRPDRPDRHPEIGRAYRTVVTVRDDLILARKDHLLTIFAGAGGQEQVHLDLEGRLHRAWLAGDSYQRGLDGRVRRVHIERPGAHQDRWLTIDVIEPEASDRIVDRVCELVGDAVSHLPGDAPDAIAEPLERAGAWDAARYAAEVARFDGVYDPIPILPPDQNRSLVIQATAGCSWNRCTFCHLYHDVRFRARPADEFRAHVRAVLELCGRALPLRRGVFIGQANALCIEQHKLVEYVRLIREELEDGRRWPLGSFIDSFTRRRSVDEFRELHELGLDSIALGLESGSERVLDCLGKPAEVREAVALVRELGDTGIRRGVIVLIGAGGHRHAEEHRRATAAAVREMQLGRRDRVYLSPLHVIEGSEYERRAQAEQLGTLTRSELVEQAEALKSTLRGGGVAAPIALYDIRRFIY